jgi:hypothetical protein
MSILAKAYEALTEEAETDLKGERVSAALQALISKALDFVTNACEFVPIESKIPHKKYACLKRKGKGKGVISRAVRDGLFDAKAAGENLRSICRADLSKIDGETRERLLYTAAMSYCCATDLLKTGDRKTTGGFFEILVAHLVAKTYGVNPKKSIDVSNLGETTQLPTDYIFVLGEEKNRIHLPVKTSTRERVIQAWAHQRVLDGVYGVGRFKGVLVCLAETNMQRKTMSVVEVCLPDQWALYQMFIAQLHRVYYFDPPEKYIPLAKKYPFIQVKHFAKFFDEADALANASPLA